MLQLQVLYLCQSSLFSMACKHSWIFQKQNKENSVAYTAFPFAFSLMIGTSLHPAVSSLMIRTHYILLHPALWSEHITSSCIQPYNQNTLHPVAASLMIKTSLHPVASSLIWSKYHYIQPSDQNIITSSCNQPYDQNTSHPVASSLRIRTHYTQLHPALRSEHITSCCIQPYH